MKATFAAFTCLALVSCAAGVKSRKSLRSQPGGNLSADNDSSASTVAAAVSTAAKTAKCDNGKENFFPLDPKAKYDALGLAKWQAMFPEDKFREAFAANNPPNWLIGIKWNLTVKANSFRNTSSRFGFAGNATQGFMELTVPAGAIDQVISVSDFVKTTAEHTRFQYLDDVRITDRPVVMTDICLTPTTCDSYVEECPEGFLKYGANHAGYNEDSCCHKALCKDDDYCLPATQWEKAADYDTRPGHNAKGCCTSKMCTEAICASEHKEWRPKNGTGWQGETKEECCEPLMCMEFQCNTSSTWKTPYPISGEYISKKGATHEHCCAPLFCDNFHCEVSKVWKDKPGKPTTRGSTFPECCQPVYCKDNDVCDGIHAKKLNETTEDGELRRGKHEDECCEKLWCKNHTCTDERLILNDAGLDRRRGSTDDICCTPKVCSDWNCSSNTKWIHKARIEKGVVIEGHNDETCCLPVLCKSYHCSPMSKWKKIENDTLQGSTNEECCEPIYCENWNCTGDIAGTDNSTQWHKKVDTNHKKYQGSSDKECCVPRHCSEYTTSHPTMYQRKKGDDIKGSTDFECYDPKLCQDYKCKDRTLIKKPCDWGLKGSTDEECCMKEK